MPAEPVVLRLKENEPKISSELTVDQAALLKRRYGKYLSVSPSWEPGAFELVARQTIGTIVLEGLRIHIEPKVPITNLFYMLTYAYDLPKFRDEEAPLAIGEELFEFVIQIFVKQVDQLIRKGIYRSYLDFEENERLLRGRLMMARHLQHNAVHVQQFYQRANEFTADLLENRILKFTLWQLSRLGLESPNLRLLLRRTLSAFSQVSLTSIVAGDCDDVHYTRLNRHYRTPVNLAKLILQHLSLEGHTGGTPFATYLLPMHQVFELFVAKFLEVHFSTDPYFDIEIKPQIWLDKEQKAQGEPDIVLQLNGQPYSILDTKYKVFTSSPGTADRNQMFMYCHTMGVSRATLIYANEAPISYQSRFKGMTLDARALPLLGPLETFRRSCRAFADRFIEGNAAADLGQALLG